MQCVVTLFFIAAVVFIGCGKSDPETETQNSPTTVRSITPYPTQAPKPAAGNLSTLTTDIKPNSNGIIELKDGEVLRIVPDGQAPVLGRPGPVVDKEGETFTIRGPGGGQHVEILIDDDEKSARIATSFPIDLGKDELPDGTHIVRVYLCAADNESVKQPEQVGIVQVHINKKTNDSDFTREPTLAYTQPLLQCRPRNVVLDFALKNVPLESDGIRLKEHAVNAVITDASGNKVEKTLTTWEPSDVDGLTKGAHTVVLQLMKVSGDGTMAPVDNSYSSTKRTFTVN